MLKAQRSVFFSSLLFSLCALSPILWGATVSDPDIDNPSGLRAALQTTSPGGGTITFSPGSYGLTTSSNQNLPPINLTNNSTTLVINDTNQSVTMNGTVLDASVPAGMPPFRGVFIYQGDVTINKFTFQNLNAQGGTGGQGIGGGGGGLGAGGAVFVGPGAKARFSHCTFTSNNAMGGDGGDASSTAAGGGGGGGGLGGNGGIATIPPGGGGGGGGLFGPGGEAGKFGGGGGGGLLGTGGNGFFGNTAQGGGGGGGGTNISSSSGDGQPGTNAAGGAGGSVNGGSGGTPPSNPGNPATGPGGGGGGGAGNGLGNGGGGTGDIFGGGGGSAAAAAGSGGSGGYGGGGGGGADISGTPGSGTTLGGGGGGAGLAGGTAGGSGAFGAGGGGGSNGGAGGAPGTTLGGRGGAGNVANSGGGGAGLGGTFFLDLGAQLFFGDGISITQGDVQPGNTGACLSGFCNPGNGGSGQGQGIFMRDNSSIICQNSDVLTLAAVINSEGITPTGTTMTMNGSGTVNLPDSIIMAMLNINTGRVNCGPNLFTSGVTVAAAGTLGGNGQLDASVSNFGTISPGTSIGTLQVFNGPVAFNNSSNFAVEISPSANSELVVSGVPGTVTIGSSTTLNVLPDPGSYTVGTIYTVINAVGVTGTFTNVTSSNPRLIFQAIYSPALTPTMVQILLASITPVSAIVVGGNAGAAAAAFTTLSPSNPDVAFLNSFFDFASPSQLQCDFDNMQPALYNAIPIAQEATTTAVRMTLTDRLGEIHGTKCPEVKCPECGVDYNKRPYKIWLTPLGNFTKQKSRSQHGICDNTKIGFNSNTWGTTLGFDTNPLEYLTIGGAVSYAHTDLGWKESAAKSQTNSVFGSVFASLFNRLVYWDLALMGAYDHFDAKRKIILKNEFSTLHRTAKHKEDAGEYDLYTGAGYTLNRNNWQLNPFITLDYQHLHQGNYKESGAQSIDLKVRKRNSNLLRTEAGAHFSICQKRTDKSSFSFIEQVKLSYIHEARYDGKKTTSEFIGPPDSSSFVVKGFWPDRDLISPGASFQLVFPTNHLSLDLRYNGEFGKNWHNQTGSLEILYAF